MSRNGPASFYAQEWIIVIILLGNIPSQDNNHYRFSRWQIEPIRMPRTFIRYTSICNTYFRRTNIVLKKLHTAIILHFAGDNTFAVKIIADFLFSSAAQHGHRHRYESEFDGHEWNGDGLIVVFIQNGGTDAFSHSFPVDGRKISYLHSDKKL